MVILRDAWGKRWHLGNAWTHKTLPCNSLCTPHTAVRLIPRLKYPRVQQIYSHIHTRSYINICIHSSIFRVDYKEIGVYLYQLLGSFISTLLRLLCVGSAACCVYRCGIAKILFFVAQSLYRYNTYPVYNIHIVLNILLAANLKTFDFIHKHYRGVLIEHFNWYILIQKLSSHTIRLLTQKKKISWR